MLCLAKVALNVFTHCIQVLHTVHTSQGQQVIVICSAGQPQLWSSVAGLDRQCMRCCYLPLSCSTDSWDWCWARCPEPLQSCVAFAGLCWMLGNAVKCLFSWRWCAADWDIKIRLPAENVCLFLNWLIANSKSCLICSGGFFWRGS